MTITNRYVKRSRISEAKFREFVKCFSLDPDAHQTGLLTGLNRNTINRYLLLIRTRIAEFCEQSSPFHEEVEVDESYFGAKRIRGKRGRGDLPPEKCTTRRPPLAIIIPATAAGCASTRSTPSGSAGRRGRFS